MISSNRYVLLFFSIFIISIFSCSEENNTNGEEDFTLRIGLKADPERLHPMISSGAYNRQVFQYIFLPLAEYDPIELTLRPILVKEIPQAIKITEGKYAGGLSYQYEILEDAIWSDGRAITAHDYVFTIQAVMHPDVAARKWRSYLREISAINIDPLNNKKFEVIVAKDFLLATEITATLQLYPKHVYDPTNALSDISLDQLKDEEWYAEATKKDSSLINFAESMNSNKYSREIVIGAGPYVLKDWKTNQYVVLDRQENYWGQNYPDNPFLQAFAKRLEFQIVADETSAISLLKSGNIDMMSNISGVANNQLKQDSSYSNQFTFLSPQIMRYYYILLNNRNPKLSDRNVRKALAYAVDIEEIIKNLEFGDATQIAGPIHPTKSYYNDELQKIEYNIEKSAALLSENGWVDTNQNGSVDKIIDGNLTELELTIMISGSELGKQIALILQQNAAKVGININIESISIREMVTKRIRPREYEMAALVSTQSASPYDPYAKWHTDQAAANGQNDSGFGTNETDQLIEQIRETSSAADRLPLYKQLQEILYEEQPILFLYAPTEKIIVNNKFVGQGSPQRPGYFANTFRLKG